MKMIGKYLKYAKIADIDILVYKIEMADSNVTVPNPDFELISHTLEKGKTKFSMTDNGVLVHNSFLYEKRHVMSLLDKVGPVIGDCVTSNDYRGRSVYPYVINRISKNLFNLGTKEVFIIVNPDNASSIRGIEKAGFKLFAEIKTKRFLSFYYNTKITRYS